MLMPVHAMVIALLALSTPGWAQQGESAADAESPALRVSGELALVSDYRYRGISESDNDVAVEGGLTVIHESGFYTAAWASTLRGWGTFGGADIELDLSLGYITAIGNAAIDTGITWISFPGGVNETDFWEGFVHVSGSTGPLDLTASVYYAPPQEALGNFSATPFSRGQSEDNLYLAGDANLPIADTPITLSGHIGYSNGNPGLGPNNTSLAPTGEYWDWSLGASLPLAGPLTLSISYIDTDIGAAESAFLQPFFSEGQDGTGSIADARLVIGLTAKF
ncbi:MAG: TorF family putative porin [Pseudomonadota bacterium]